MSKGIILTPNFTAMRTTFSTMVEYKVAQIIADATAKDHATLADVRDVIAKLNIAVQAIDSTAALEAVRELINTQTLALAAACDALDAERDNEFDEETESDSPADYKRTETVEHKCANGHQWQAEMFSELGGWFYEIEALAYCPLCGEQDINDSK